MRSRRLLLAAATAATLLPATLRADSTWLGGTGSWSDATRWSGGTVPVENAHVWVDGGQTAVSSYVTASATDAMPGNVTIDAGDTVEMPRLAVVGPLGGGQVTVNGTLVLSGQGIQNAPLGPAFSVAGTGIIRFTGSNAVIAPQRGGFTIPAGLTFQGPFTHTGGGSAGRPLYNFGKITVDGSGHTVTIGQAEGITSENSGLITATGGARLWIYYDFYNRSAGVVSLTDSSLTFDDPPSGVGLTNAGAINLTRSTLTFTTSLLADLSRPLTLNGVSLNDSTVQGSTLVTLGLTHCQGTVSTATNLLSQPNSHFAFDLAPTGGDTLTVAGKLDLSAAGDSLDLTALDPSALTLPYTLATAPAGITGTFDHVTPGFSLKYTPTSILVTSVPEPAGILLALALPALLPTRRTRKRKACPA